jgi:hypothetical protein
VRERERERERELNYLLMPKGTHEPYCGERERERERERARERERERESLIRRAHTYRTRFMVEWAAVHVAKHIYMVV